MWPFSGLLAFSGFEGPCMPKSGFISVLEECSSPCNPSVVVRFLTQGIVTVNPFPGPPDPVKDWIEPPSCKAPSPNQIDPADYEIFLHVIAGDGPNLGDATEMWISLATGVEWTWDPGFLGQMIGNGTISVREIAVPANLAVWSWDIEVAEE